MNFKFKRKLLDYFLRAIKRSRLQAEQKEVVINSSIRVDHYYTIKTHISGMLIKYSFIQSFISGIIYVEVKTDEHTFHFTLFILPFTKARKEVHAAIRKFNGIKSPEDIKEEERIKKQRKDIDRRRTIYLITNKED